MSKIDVILDISNKNLCEIPPYVLEMTNLKMLYLEGNQIEVLPEELFIKLKKLVWLDARRNKLKTIPQSIANHENLETLLLRDNEISLLPLELGLVPNLKVLQISGNPIVYPKSEIIQEGISCITSYLKKQYESANEYVTRPENPAEPNLTCKLSKKDKVHNININPKNIKPILKVRNFRKDSKSCIPHHKLKNRLVKSFSKSSNNVYKDYQGLNLKNHEQKVEDKYLKDMWMFKLKDIMKFQDDQIQREKDLETLKNWQQSLQHRHKRPLAVRRDVPFGISEDYLRMPTRKDLQREDKPSKLCKTQPKTHKAPANVEKYISEIIESLQNMRKEQGNSNTPRGQMDKAGRDINKIIELQKRLSVLKLAIAKDIKS